MNRTGFNLKELDQTWQDLINFGPRFMGTPNETLALEYIQSQLKKTSALVREQTFNYVGWSLLAPPQVQVVTPSAYNFPCQAFIGSHPTPQEGIFGTVSYVGIHRVIDAFDWVKLAVETPDGQLLGYISGCKGSPAHPQPLDPASATVPHFIIGDYEIRLICSWLERGLKVEVNCKMESDIYPGQTARNLVASFNSGKKAIALCAHYDSVYNTMGANDNAAAVAVLLEIARRAELEKINVPLELIFFTGEEWGMLGSKTYVKEAKNQGTLNNLKALINLDSIAEGSSLEFWSGPENFENQLRSISLTFPHPPNRNILFRFPPPTSSDHYPFYAAGVPVCMLFCGDTVKYHVTSDQYCPEGLENMRYIADLTWHLIQKLADQQVSRHQCPS